MKLNIQAICHKGLVRENNEDALSIGGLFLRDDSTEIALTTPEDGFFYLLVSDGMGGQRMGSRPAGLHLTLLPINSTAGKSAPGISWTTCVTASMKSAANSTNRQH